MFRWCAYCWKLMGEREPFDDLSTTHGICDRCLDTDAPSDEDIIARTRPIKALHARLYGIAAAGCVDEVHELIAAWETLGLGAIELLVAVLQPALYLAGRAWERGELLPIQEARLSRFCNEVLAVLCQRQLERIPLTKGRPLLLFSAGGNNHDMGIKMLAFALREGGRDVRVLPGAQSPEHLRVLCEALGPAALGVSLALATQASYVTRLVDALATLPHVPRIVVGGGALSEIETLPSTVVRWTTAESLLGAALFFENLERSSWGPPHPVAH